MCTFQDLKLNNVIQERVNVHVDHLFLSAPALLSLPQTPADWISCDSQPYGTSDGIICHLTFRQSRQAGLSERWVMNEYWWNIDPSRFQAEWQISHFDRGHDSSSYMQAGRPLLETWSSELLCTSRGDSCDIFASMACQLIFYTFH